MSVCNCTLAGTRACDVCPNGLSRYISHPPLDRTAPDYEPLLRELQRLADRITKLEEEKERA